MQSPCCWHNHLFQQRRSRRCHQSRDSNHTYHPSLWALCLFYIGSFALPATAQSTQAYQPLEQIRESAEEFLRSILDNDGTRKSVQIGQIDSRLRLSRCPSPLVAFLPAGVRPQGNITVGVRCAGPKPWKLYVSAKVRIYQEVVVLRRSLPRHSRIAMQDVVLAELETTFITSPVVTEIAEAIGKELTRSVTADRPLTYSMLRQPVVVRRGQRVTLLYRSPGIEVRGSATALDDGGRGEQISARPLGASRTLTGVVLRPGVVLVNQK